MVNLICVSVGTSCLMVVLFGSVSFSIGTFMTHNKLVTSFISPAKASLHLIHRRDALSESWLIGPGQLQAFVA